MAVSTLWCVILLCSFSYTSAQPATASHWITNDTNFGPVINLFCTVTDTTYLGSDNHLSAAARSADPTRYSISVGDVPNKGYGSLLQIRNALKQHAGFYTCRVLVEGNPLYSTDRVEVIINQYLPPPGYPECSIGPSPTLLEHTDATFSCIPGEASPPMDLTLILERQSGLHVELGSTNVTKQVTMDDNNTMFICNMSSETFPAAPQRMCSAGPIIISQAPPTTKSSMPIETLLPTDPETGPVSENVVTKTYGMTKEKTITYTNNPLEQPLPVGGIIGGIVGVILLVLIGVVIIIIKYTRSKPSDENITKTPTSNQQTSSSADHPGTDHTYMAYQRYNEQEPYAEINLTNMLPSTNKPQFDIVHTYMMHQQDPHQEPNLSTPQNETLASGYQSPSTDNTYINQKLHQLHLAKKSNSKAISSSPDYQDIDDDNKDSVYEDVHDYENN
ncbi:uncharacterized protein [Amphiura filiformis]|uniref:uncharacterized protein n=1 Tax=Amphiura filiformis TaxID=82378 RepID=UPI003B20DE0F